MLLQVACSSDDSPLSVVQNGSGDTASVGSNNVTPSGNSIGNEGSSSLNVTSDTAVNNSSLNDTANGDASSSSGNFASDVSAASITEVVLVTGQSNALGLDTFFDAQLDQPHPRAYAFTETGWQVADLRQVWDLGWYPRTHPEADPINNFGFHFARKVAERRPDRVIGFILVTAPGAGIEHWDYESEFYVKIRDRVVAAINELPSKATIDGILWHQGETDWRDTDFYAAKLNDVIRNFRGESWFGDSRPFICGETVIAPVNNRLRALNNDGDAWTGCVGSEGLQTLADGLHFSAEGLRTIGTRYATKYLQMTEQ